ncbi:hypothetical protein QYF61_016137 [Mycteria americana]|uniref:Uncharacterized protein n=1 Tax=Mycteria americana TaxID=33587 RepID=A0AAN7N660_MYCAM|nr:hypothetical protein QYF61_016137 [Mycteria americana]
MRPPSQSLTHRIVNPPNPSLSKFERRTLWGTIYLSHFNLSSLIHLLVVLMFLSGPTLGYMSIYVTYFYNQVLYPGSNILPQGGSPDGFASALPLEYSRPRILCTPDSKTLGVDLESPLVFISRDTDEPWLKPVSVLQAETSLSDLTKHDKQHNCSKPKKHQYYVLLSTCDTMFSSLFITTTQKTVLSYCSQQVSSTNALCKSSSRRARIDLH